MSEVALHERPPNGRRHRSLKLLPDAREVSKSCHLVHRPPHCLYICEGEWPEWWVWEIDCSNPHLLKRMLDRRFNETDRRTMLQRATGLRPDGEFGRWIVTAHLDSKSWEIIVEPDMVSRILVVVTAYPVG